MPLVPRQMRIECPGGIYHVLNRGDRREAIFRDDGDCHDFIKTLAEACQKTGFQVHALGWKESHLSQRPKTDSEKVGMRARLRAETTMTIGQIAQRLQIGTRNTLSAKLQERKAANE